MRISDWSSDVCSSDLLHHGGMTRQPGRMRVTRIQHRIFQQAQAPAMRCFRPAMTAQPVEPVVGMPTQVLPSERERIQPKEIQVCGSRIPMREVLRRDHEVYSCDPEGSEESDEGE